MKARKQLFIKVCIVLLAISILGFWFSYTRGGRYLSLKPLEFDNMVSLYNGVDQQQYIVNSSGQQVLRINQNGQVDLLLRGAGHSGKANEVAVGAVADADGNLYVHTVFSHDKALSWYGGEYISLYDSKGTFVKDVYANIYSAPAVKYNIKHMQSSGEEVYAIELGDDSIRVRDLTGSTMKEFSMPDAGRMVSSAGYQPSTSTVFVYTKDGHVLLVRSDAIRTVYTTKAAGLEEMIFSDMTVGQDGKLYLTDAGSGELYNIVQSVAVPAEMDEPQCPETADFSGMYKFFHVVSLLCLALGSISLIELALYGIYWLFTKGSPKLKLVACFALIIGGVSVGICTYFANYLEASYRDNIVENELTAAKNLDSILDKDAFARLQSVTDFQSEDYNTVKKAADIIMLDEKGTPGQLYLMMYTFEENDCLYVRYSEDEGYGCNYPYVEDEEEGLIYETGEPIVFDMLEEQNGVFQSIYYPIHGQDDSVIGIIEIGCDLTAFNKIIDTKIRDLLFSIAAVCIVIMLIVLEFIEFAMGRSGMDRKALRQDGSVVPVKLYRLAVFLIFFLTNISTPFLAIYALSLSKDISATTGISPEILAAVPLSAEVLSGAIFSFLGSGIIRKLGSRKAAILGSIVFAGGLAVRVIYPSIILLIVGNLIQGAGWGILLLIVNARIAAVEDEKVQESGFTDYNIAVQNGLNSGVVFGGFLLAYTGYQNILLIVAILSVSMILYSLYVIYDEKKKAAAQEEKGKASDYFRFIASPRVFFYLILIVLPVIAASYYLNYLYPILADNLGMSEEWIGYSYLLNGIVMICLGNLINEFVAKRVKNKARQLMYASIIYLVMFGLVGYFNNITVLLISLVLMAVTCSFGYVAQSTYYSELKEVEELGYEKAMGIYSLFENLAQTAGSFLFGYVMILGMRKGLFLFGGIIAGCGIVFAVIVAIYNKKKSGSS